MEIKTEEKELFILLDQDESNKNLSETSRVDNGARALAAFLRTELTPAGLYFELICETKDKEFEVEILNPRTENKITLMMKVVEEDRIILRQLHFDNYYEVDNYTSKVKFFWIAIASILQI
jgi:hypothetical protein